MPIVERDPWRMQYFEGVSCPDDVLMPTEDADSYRLFPQQRWIYNKLLVAELQNMDCGLHGLAPESFPVFSKPVYNMRGMGAGSRVLRNPREYQLNQKPGHMWMPLLKGEHVSSDAAVVDGEPRWWRHVIGKAIDEGMFDYWTVLAEARPEIESYCGDWLRARLRDYTGMVNFETIDARIIEVHLRFSDQWPDLYGAGWIEALVRLYVDRVWDFADEDRRDGYSVVLFGPHGLQYRHPDPELISELLEAPRAHQHPDHLPRAQAAQGALHAARRLSPGDRQRLGPRGRDAGARAPGAALLGDPAHRAAPPAPPRQAVARATAARRPASRGVQCAARGRQTRRATPSMFSPRIARTSAST